MLFRNPTSAYANVDLDCLSFLEAQVEFFLVLNGRGFGELFVFFEIPLWAFLLLIFRT